VSTLPVMSPPQKRRVADDAYKAERARLLLAFAEKLRAERERRNLSQESLAAIANVHRTHLGALERGLREPHLAMLLSATASTWGLRTVACGDGTRCGVPPAAPGSYGVAIAESGCRGTTARNRASSVWPSTSAFSRARSSGSRRMRWV
jgi:DNA-binding XRE family transcriptional regulator